MIVCWNPTKEIKFTRWRTNCMNWHSLLYCFNIVFGRKFMNYHWFDPIIRFTKFVWKYITKVVTRVGFAIMNYNNNFMHRQVLDNFGNNCQFEHFKLKFWHSFWQIQDYTNRLHFKANNDSFSYKETRIIRAGAVHLWTCWAWPSSWWGTWGKAGWGCRQCRLAGSRTCWRPWNQDIKFTIKEKE